MTFVIKNTSGQSSNSSSTPLHVSLRCPSCKQQGTFESIGLRDAVTQDGEKMGQRRCPNDSCYAHVFIVRDRGNKVILSYPAERIEFDTTNIPSAITNALEEAITCHANSCFIAAAIMVRKTLEELCSAQNAKGGNLKDRIKNLGAKIVIPKELIEGVDDLRLLGNDAAHIESKEFNQIGQDEVEIGIEFTKEVLKAAYQYSTLLERLRGLKKKPEIT